MNVIPQMLVTNNAAASYTSLLEIIQDKEKELSRIRQTANVVAEEEKLAVQRKFAELQDDFHHNLELLRDKDDKIKRLERSIEQLQRDHTDSLNSVEERCHERATLEISKAASKAEEQFRKKFRMEYEEKLSASERETKKEFQMTLFKELQNQEMMLSEKFDCVLSRLETEHKQHLNDVCRQLEEKEKDLIVMENASKSKLRDVEARVMLEAEARVEKTLSMKIREYELQSEMNIRRIMEEKNLLGEKLRQLEHTSREVEIRNKDLLWKNDELLGIIQNLEQSYVEKIQGFEADRKKWITQSKVMQEKSESLEALFRECKEKHRNQLKDLEKQAQLKRKLLSREIRKLTKKLATTKEEKEEVEELMKEKEEEGHSSKQELKKRIISLKSECKELRRQITSCHGLVSFEPSDDSSWNEEISRKLKIKEDSLTVLAHEEMRTRFVRELNLKKDEFEKEIQRLTKEKDELTMQRNAMKRKNDKQETDCTKLRSELSCLRKKLLESESWKRENDTLKFNLNSLEDQQVQLKETIKLMRREMESLIEGHHPSESEIETYSAPCQHKQESLHKSRHT
jgi:hypothetical protein